jgi:1-deoxy-D-xylulose-5-phosphate synthase
MAPKDAGELANMLYTAVRAGSPVALRYPRGAVARSAKAPLRGLAIGKSETLRDGDDLAIIALGPIAREACEAGEELAERGIEARVINARFVKPLDESAVLSAARECGGIVLVEENVARGGFASAVLECLARHGAHTVPVETVALPDSFIGFGKASELRSNYGLSKQGIIGAAETLLARMESPRAAMGEELVIRQSI